MMVSAVLKKLLHLIRWDEWYDSKLPLLAATAYFINIRNPLPWPEAGVRTSLIIVFCALFLGYGYAVNDFSDIKADMLVGKKKLMAEIPRSTAVFFLAVLALLGISVLSPYYHDPKVMFAVVFCYLLGTVYSLPPIRLKERGVAGLLVSAIAQRSMPVLVMGAVWKNIDIALLGWAFLGFLAGIRYILIHQYQDISADLQSGVTTFATGNPHVIARLVRWVLATEIITILFLFFYISRGVAGFIIFTAIYVLYSGWYYSLLKRLAVAPSLLSFTHVPLADLYSLFLPVGFLIFLSIDNIKWLLFMLTEILWKKRYAAHHFSLYYYYVSGIRQGFAKRGWRK